MAQKSGGGWFWLLVGILAGIAMTLAALLFLNAGSGDVVDNQSVADEAAASAAGQLPEAPAPVAPAKAETAAAPIPIPHDAGLDPASDDQIADDAAAAGMTSRAPPPAPRGE
ncbi:MAG TPA: hypothetical protein PLO65_04690 [Caulobacter sp.]|nr:hypothetical protein [Caulobacter sp.]